MSESGADGADVGQRYADRGRRGHARADGCVEDVEVDAQMDAVPAVGHLHREVGGLGLVMVWDDGDDTLAEPRAPYPHVREVLLQRAEQSGSAALIGGFACTPEAHHLLEKHVLTKQQLYWKDQLSNWYGQLMHEAQYLEPVMRNIETFLARCDSMRRAGRA